MHNAESTMYVPSVSGGEVQIKEPDVVVFYRTADGSLASREVWGKHLWFDLECISALKLGEFVAWVAKRPPENSDK